MVIAEAEICLSTLTEDGERVERLHQRLSQAGETVFILKERATEVGFDNLQMERYHRDMEELSSNLTRLRVFFENRDGELNSNAVHLNDWCIDPRELIQEWMSGFLPVEYGRTDSYQWSMAEGIPTSVPLKKHSAETRSIPVCNLHY